MLSLVERMLEIIDKAQVAQALLSSITKLCYRVFNNVESLRCLIFVAIEYVVGRQ